MSANKYSSNLYLLFFLIASIKISLSKKQSLILPYKIFHPPIDEQSTKEETFLSLKRNYFYTEFEIGNPKQKIPMIYTFNYSELIFHSDTNFLLNLESTYNPDKSESFKNLENNVAQENLLFNINNEICIKNFNFLNEAQNKKDVNYYSYVGMQNFYKENKDKNIQKPNFLYQLKELGLIDYISFSINQTSEDGGFININFEPNEYAPELYSNKKKYTAPIRKLESETINNMAGEYLWSIDIGFGYFKFERKMITINIDHYELKEDQYAALLNPAYGLISSPLSYMNLMKKTYFHEFMKKNICTYSFINSMRFYSCNADYREELQEKFLPLYFYYPLPNFSYTYTYVLYFDDLFYEKNGILYFLVTYDSTTFETDKFAHVAEWVLGKPFLDKYQFSFDVEKNEVSFYENINGYKNKTTKNVKNANIAKKNLTQNKNNNINLAFISFAIFIMFILFFCIFYKIKEKNKEVVKEDKKEIELRENLEDKE